MSPKLIAYVLSLLLFIFPFRWAFLSDSGHAAQLAGLVLCIAGFFAVVILFDKGRKASSH